MPTPTPREAIGILRRSFGAFDPRYEDAPESDPKEAYGDTGGALLLNALRSSRASELADQIDQAEAASLIRRPGSPGTYPSLGMLSNASDLATAHLQRQRLGRLGAEMAADPYTGEAEQERVQGRRDALEKAETLRRPELTHAAQAVASRNAFGEFLNRQKRYEADISEAGRTALDAASRRKIAEEQAGAGFGRLVQVPDPANPGHTIWTRAQDAVGSAGPLSSAERTRVLSAQTVLDTGNDIIARLSDPNVANQLGPAMGRYNTLRDFIGNPPPELSGLAGQIESFALSNMGVHGMRSARGAEELKKMFDQKHTPQSLIEAVKGLSQFSQQFVANATGAGGGTDRPTILSIEKE